MPTGRVRTYAVPQVLASGCVLYGNRCSHTQQLLGRGLRGYQPDAGGRASSARGGVLLLPDDAGRARQRRRCANAGAGSTRTRRHQRLVRDRFRLCRWIGLRRSESTRARDVRRCVRRHRVPGNSCCSPGGPSALVRRRLGVPCRPTIVRPSGFVRPLPSWVRVNRRIFMRLVRFRGALLWRTRKSCQCRAHRVRVVPSWQTTDRRPVWVCRLRGCQCLRLWY